MQNPRCEFLLPWWQGCGETDLQCEDIVLWSEVNKLCEGQSCQQFLSKLVIMDCIVEEKRIKQLFPNSPGSNVNVAV